MHPLVQEYLDITRGRATDAQLVAVEGLWALEHALAHDIDVRTVVACRERWRGDDAARTVEHARAAGASVVAVGERTFCRLVERDGPDGIAATVRRRRTTLADVRVDRGPVVVVDGIELPGNLGTIVRCADGAGAAGVIVVGGQVRLTHPLVVKASMATCLSLPIVEAGLDDAIEWLRRAGCTVVAADPSAPVSYREASYPEALAVVVGHERTGLDDRWRAEADVLVSIPMLGVADSLNVTHAAALVLYEALHRRQGRGS